MREDSKVLDKGRKRQKFCCPLRLSKDADCLDHHFNFYKDKKHRGCIKYITNPDDLRISFDRSSPNFKSNYSLRVECKRYNSHFKNTEPQTKSAKRLHDFYRWNLFSLGTGLCLC